MSTPIDPSNIPAVPRRDHDVTDRIGRMTAEQNELRQTFYGVARGGDAEGNLVLGSETVGWGISKPRIHVPAYPTQPYLSTPAGGAYTWTMFYSHTFKPESQLVSTYVRWSVLESVITTTAVGEFEWRWNRGRVPGQRGFAPTNSILFDSWDSGTPGSKGQDGSSIRNSQLQFPSTGPAAVGYWEPLWVSFAVWGRIRTATGGVNDAAKVAPLGLYQSGIGQG